MSITPSKDQEIAIEAIEDWLHRSKNPYFAVGGLAGTGKSTIAAVLANRLKDRGMRTVFAAPTGKAAAVLRAKGQPSAFTLHSLLYRVAGTHVDDDGNESPIFVDKSWESHCDLLVVDEASMVTTRLFNDIADRGVRTLFIGDHGQLPPVGGNPRIMERATVRLEKIHRQAEGSGILQVAHAVRNGHEITAKHKSDDVRIGKILSLEHAVQTARKLGVSQTIVATNSERHRFNDFWRGELKGKPPAIGERLMCLCNNRLENIWNGQSYVVEKIRVDSGEIGVYDLRSEDDGSVRKHLPIYLPGLLDPTMASRENLYEGANLFTFSYACTAHKMQGSQAKHVMVIDRPTAEPERWRYTAYTRAEEQLTIAKYS